MTGLVPTRGTIRLAISAAISFCLAFATAALSTGTYVPIVASSGEVVPGEWNASVTAGKAYADANHVPMLAIYGSPLCSHCQQLQTACNTDEFKKWAAYKKIVMVFSETSDAKQFCKPPDSNLLPFVCVYWNKKDGTTTQARFTGTLGTMPSSAEDTLVAQFISSCELHIGSYPYAGGEFTVPGTDSHEKLEIEEGYAAGRTAVVPLHRTSGISSGENTLVANGAAYPVAWQKGETKKYIPITISDGLTAGTNISLELLDDNDAVHATSSIAIVQARANSVTNPYWLGERTPETLDWGEWTMDVDCATNKVAAEEGAAYTIVYFSGVLWCPWCQGLESAVLKTDVFQAWCRKNKVALVVLDNPRRSPSDHISGEPPFSVSSVPDGRPPTLLRYESGNNNVIGRTGSGASYMTRKGISVEAAEAKLQQNHTLGYRGGFYAAPEAWRTGYPTMILLRKDGTIAGRLKYYAPTTTSFDTKENMARLDDLLLLANGKGERDNYATTTTRRLACGGEAVGVEAQVNDAVEMFAVTSVPVGTVRFSVEGKPASHDVTLAVIRIADGKQTTLATGQNVVSYDFGPEETRGIYLKATAFPKTACYGRNTTFGFSIASDITLHPGVIEFAEGSPVFVSSEGTGHVALRRQGGVSGEARVRVVLASAAGTAKEGQRFVWKDTEVVWNEGDASDKMVSFGLISGGSGDIRETFVLKLTDARAAAIGKNDTKSVEVFDTDKPTLKLANYESILYAGFDASEGLAAPLYNIPAGNRVAIKKEAGQLPAGVKIVYDETTGIVTLKGVANKPGTYHVSVAFGDKTLNTSYGPVAEIAFTVKDPALENPNLSKPQKMTIPLLRAREDGDSEVAGALDFSARASNSITAKYIRTATAARTTFKGVWRSLADGQARAELVAKSGERLMLVLSRDGFIAATVEDANYQEHLTSGSIYADDGRQGAAFDGYYTVALPELADGAEDAAGAGYVTLTAAAGRVKWKGMLANGQNMAGIAYLGIDSDGLGVVPLIRNNRQSSFSALLVIRPHAGSAQSRRAVRLSDGTIAVWTDGGIPHRCKAWGSWFVKNDSLEALCAASGLATTQQLVLDASAFNGSSYGALLRLPTAVAVFSDSKIALMDSTERLKLSYQGSTGIIKGSTPIAFSGKTITGKLAGVVIPGWYDCGCEMPNPADKFQIIDSMPFMLGSAQYVDRTGNSSVKRSFPLLIQEE